MTAHSDLVLSDEEQTIAEVILAARRVQHFLWGDFNDVAGLEEWRRMLRKRVSKLDGISVSNPHWKVELRKRLLQTAAIAVNLITRLDHGCELQEEQAEGFPTNLEQYGSPSGDE